MSLDLSSGMSSGSFASLEGAPLLRNKQKFPKRVYFIIFNELCERFSFYGLKAILAVYLTDAIVLSEVRCACACVCACMQVSTTTQRTYAPTSTPGPCDHYSPWFHHDLLCVFFDW